MKYTFIKSAVISVAFVTLLTGCATIGEDSSLRRFTSGALGGVAGLWYCVKHKISDAECLAVVAASAGIGIVAGEIAYNVKKSYQERHAKIAEIDNSSEVNVSTSDYVVVNQEEAKALGEKVAELPEQEQAKTLRDAGVFRTTVTGLFASGSANLAVSKRNLISNIAREYGTDGKREILIVGHADSFGVASENQSLSEARALAVARIFIEQGFPKESVYYQGAGESEPIANNTTAVGRVTNRRVELIDASTSQSLARAKHIFSEESAVAIILQNEQVSEQPTQPVVAEPQSQPTPIVANVTNSSVAFGGKPYSDELADISIDGVANDSSSGGLFISVAHASNAQNIPRFIDDDAPITGDIKRTDGGESLYDFADYLPGYKNLTAYFRSYEKLFSLQPIAVLKKRLVDSSTVGAKVYNAEPDNEWKTESTLHGSAVSYPSKDKKLALYRWKADKKSVANSGILGVDILLRTFTEQDFGKKQKLPTKVFYYNNGALHVADIVMTVKLPKDINPDWRFY